MDEHKKTYAHLFEHHFVYLASKHTTRLPLSLKTLVSTP